MQEVTYNSPSFLDDTASHPDRRVHMFVVGNNADVVKQLPIFRELKNHGHNVVMIHAGDGYDKNFSAAMLVEFGLVPHVDINAHGSACEVLSQIVGRVGYVIKQLKEQGKTVVPYVFGDTNTSLALAHAAHCHDFACVHMEAGVRTLTPNYEAVGFPKRSPGDRSSLPDVGHFDVDGWRDFLMHRDSWLQGSLEPSPEQFNTRGSEAAAGAHLASVELNKQFLLAEGYPEDRMFVIGNSIVDTLVDVIPASDRSSIFQRYPVLAEGNFVRFCIYRRENCISERRFRVLYEAMSELIRDGRKVLFISMKQTEEALKQYDLKSDIDALAREFPNFVYSSMWPEYTDVIAAMRKAAVCATDSGTMQEEASILGVPCVTLRFGTDRAETVMNGGNIIAPPIDAILVKRIIEYAWDNPKLRRAPKIYGLDVSSKTVATVEQILLDGEVSRTEEERLRI